MGLVIIALKDRYKYERDDYEYNSEDDQEPELFQGTYESWSKFYHRLCELLYDFDDGDPSPLDMIKFSDVGSTVWTPEECEILLHALQAATKNLDMKEEYRLNKFIDGLKLCSNEEMFAVFC